MVLVHPELASTGARAPVDVPHAVARDERSQVCELDSSTPLPRDVIPRVHLCVPGSQQLANGLLARIDLERLPAVENELVVEEAKDVMRT